MTHGSVQKSGKVRNQTPKVERKHHLSRFPRTRVKHIYNKRYIKGITSGQQTSTKGKR